MANILNSQCMLGYLALSPFLEADGCVVAGFDKSGWIRLG